MRCIQPRARLGRAALMFLLCATGMQTAGADEAELRDQIRFLKERLQVLEIDREARPFIFSGTAEVEMGFREDGSDITLATLEMGSEVTVHKGVKGHIVFLYEEDTTPFEVDQVVLTLANAEQTPFFLSMGRMYVPFGHYRTSLVSDPLTLELGETRESAAQVGLIKGAWHGSVFAFNGDAEDGGQDKVEQYGTSLGMARSAEWGSLHLGLSYMNSLADSDALSVATIQGFTGGLSAYALYYKGPWTFLGEYLGATDRFDVSEVDYNGQGAEPSTWNIEGAYAFELAGKEAQVALSYQASKQALFLAMPKRRQLLAFSYGIAANTAVSIEWARDKDYALGMTGGGNVGTGEISDNLTLQLATGF